LSRLGLLGGTFDPPHVGHLIAASEAAWRLGLERVLFLPARQNPLKQAHQMTPPEVRCEMVAAAIADNSTFELSRLELDRPPPSYTVDLLRALRAPERELVFIAGADILPELPRWHAPAEVLQLATLAIVTRPNAPPPDLTAVERELAGAAASIQVIRIPGIDIASSQLRARVRAGQPVRYMTPPAVEALIERYGLYAA